MNDAKLNEVVTMGLFVGVIHFVVLVFVLFVVMMGQGCAEWAPIKATYEQDGKTVVVEIGDTIDDQEEEDGEADGDEEDKEGASEGEAAEVDQ